jgi:hypothetical protein
MPIAFQYGLALGKINLYKGVLLDISTCSSPRKKEPFL